jgi:hypothetical protein
MKKRYEWLGDEGEIVGHVVFAPGSRGQIVELDREVADQAVAGGFPLIAVNDEQPAELAKDEVI